MARALVIYSCWTTLLTYYFELINCLQTAADETVPKTRVRPNLPACLASLLALISADHSSDARRSPSDDVSRLLSSAYRHAHPHVTVDNQHSETLQGSKETHIARHHRWSAVTMCVGGGEGGGSRARINVNFPKVLAAWRRRRRLILIVSYIAARLM